jgi:hypothetical protein
MNSYIISLIGLILIVLISTLNLYEPYINYPQLPVPGDIKKQDTAAIDQANVNYRSLLQFVEANPDRSFKFIADLKTKFFDDSCKIKQPRIDFANLAATYQPVF